MRPQERSVRSGRIEPLFPAVDGHDQFGIARRTQFSQLSVQVRDVRRAGSFVQIIDILGNYIHVETLLQARNSAMARIRFLLEHLAAAHVVKIDDLRPIIAQRLGRTDIFDPVVGPQPVGIAESSQSAVGAHAGTRKNNDLFHRVKDSVNFRKISCIVLKIRSAGATGTNLPNGRPTAESRKLPVLIGREAPRSSTA